MRGDGALVVDGHGERDGRRRFGAGIADRRRHNHQVRLGNLTAGDVVIQRACVIRVGNAVVVVIGRRFGTAGHPIEPPHAVALMHSQQVVDTPVDRLVVDPDLDTGQEAQE